MKNNFSRLLKPCLMLGLLLCSCAVAAQYSFSSRPMPSGFSVDVADKPFVYTREQQDRLDAVHLAREAILLMRRTGATPICGVDSAKGFLAEDKDEGILYLVYLDSENEVRVREVNPIPDNLTCLDAHGRLASFADDVEDDIRASRRQRPPQSCTADTGGSDLNRALRRAFP